MRLTAVTDTSLLTPSQLITFLTKNSPSGLFCPGISLFERFLLITLLCIDILVVQSYLNYNVSSEALSVLILRTLGNECHFLACHVVLQCMDEILNKSD